MRKSQNMTACPLFARTVGPEFTAANHVYPLEKKAGFGSFFVKIYPNAFHFQYILLMLLLLCLHVLIVLPWSIAAQSSVTTPLNNSQVWNSALTVGGIQHYFFDSTTSHGPIASVPPTLTTSTTVSSHSSIASPAVSSATLHPNARSIVSRAGTLEAIYLTVTVCSQPQPPANYQGLVPPLQVFVSTSSSNSLPGPGVPGTSPIDNPYPGYSSWNSTSSPTNQMWIGVSAPSLSNGWAGNWTYQLGVSTIGRA